MEALGARTMHTIERSREHMLARVLLHMIEPPRPVDLPAHLGPLRERRRDDVHHAAILEVDHVINPHPAEHPRVEGLPAGRGIERRTIEHDGRAPVTIEHLSDGAAESGQVRVGVVEAEGHGHFKCTMHDAQCTT